jgi:predicted esterase
LELHDIRAGFNVESPDGDLNYMIRMLDILRRSGRARRPKDKSYSIDNNKIYYIGYSNGAIFSSIVAQKYGNLYFKAMVNIMGRFGENASEVTDLNIVNPLPILFITGSNDPYKIGCEYAFNFFKNRGYNVNINISEDTDHTYPISHEKLMISYLFDH